MLKQLFFLFFVKPLALLVVGLNITNRQALPKKGPAIIAANHNSHLDTLVLSSLFPIKLLPSVRPLAAADYFLKNKLMSFIALKLIGIIPIRRDKIDRTLKDPFEDAYKALEAGQILILFPEGTRGEAEQISHFKNGVARLAAKFPAVPVIPVFLHGLGKALPRGEAVLVPFFCDIIIGEGIKFQTSKKDFMELLTRTFEDLSHKKPFPKWDT